jgi:hypothetical protein
MKRLHDEHAHMVSVLAKSGADIFASLTSVNCHLLHMAVGISGEAGEVLECVCSPNGVDVANLVEELGDIEFYVEGLRQGANLTRFETITAPIDGIIYESAGIHISVSASQILDLIKKTVIYNKPLNTAELISALSSLELAMQILRDNHTLIRDEILLANIAKLSVRYKSLTYNDSAAQTWADKQES